MTTSTGPYAALKIPDYRNFVLARICITLAMQIQGTVVGWQVYQLTHDKAALAFIGLAEVIPAVGVSLYAGHIVDSTERKKVILWTVSVLLACSLSLLSFTWSL